MVYSCSIRVTIFKYILRFWSSSNVPQYRCASPLCKALSRQQAKRGGVNSPQSVQSDGLVLSGSDATK